MRWSMKCPKCGQYRKGFNLHQVYAGKIQCNGCERTFENPLFYWIYEEGKRKGRKYQQDEYRRAIGVTRYG